MSAYVNHSEVVAERNFDMENFESPMSLSITRAAMLEDDLSAIKSVVVHEATITRQDEEGDEQKFTLYRDDVVWLIANLPAVLALMPVEVPE